MSYEVIQYTPFGTFLVEVSGGKKRADELVASLPSGQGYSVRKHDCSRWHVCCMAKKS